MPEKEMSLREMTLKGLRSVHAQLLATLEDTPSKPVVERKLAEAFQRKEEAIGELCDRMEGNLRAQQELYLSAFKEQFIAITDKIVAACKQSGDISSFERELKQAQTSGLDEFDQQSELFAESWRLELARETTVIARKFYDEAHRIIMEGVMADEAMANLDRGSSPKN
jgi:uncharacterized protein YcaQ